jgi:hypothetical protein
MTCDMRRSLLFSEFIETPPLTDDDDQTRIIITPFPIAVNITPTSHITVTCQLELQVAATHHVGARKVC